MINLRKKEKDDVHVYTEALNDIMFFLMLFFIFAALMKSDSVIKVSVPKASQGKIETPSKNEVTLSVTKDATTGAILYYFKDQPVAPEQLEAAILQEKYSKASGETVVMIRMDKTIEYQIFVDMLAITSKTGVKSLAAIQK